MIMIPSFVFGSRLWFQPSCNSCFKIQEPFLWTSHLTLVEVIGGCALFDVLLLYQYYMCQKWHETSGSNCHSYLNVGDGFFGGDSHGQLPQFLNPRVPFWSTGGGSRYTKVAAHVEVPIHLNDANKRMKISSVFWLLYSLFNLFGKIETQVIILTWTVALT